MLKSDKTKKRHIREEFTKFYIFWYFPIDNLSVVWYNYSGKLKKLICNQESRGKK